MKKILKEEIEKKIDYFNLFAIEACIGSQNFDMGRGFIPARDRE